MLTLGLVKTQPRVITRSYIRERVPGGTRTHTAKQASRRENVLIYPPLQPVLGHYWGQKQHTERNTGKGEAGQAHVVSQEV